MRRITIAVVVGVGATLSAQSPAAPETRPSFSQWLDGVRVEARARGIRQDVIDSALSDVTEPVPEVIERDRSQAETVLPLEKYITSRVTTRLVRSGRDAYIRHRQTLDQVAARYGVPARIIAGIWGMESNFGSFSGVRPTISALATLAWDPRRTTFFQAELFDALEILNRGDIDLKRLRGSWAGAMGQPQFMPSSYLKYAEDFDGDGRRDIWGTPGDVFASIANYLIGNGWVRGHAWGREVKISKELAADIAGTLPRRTGGCRATRDMTMALPLTEWQKMGVRTLQGGNLPTSDDLAFLVSGSSRHFLTYQNYDALLLYNCAHAYALSVVVLGDSVARSATRFTGRP